MAAEKFKAKDLEVSEFTLDNIGVWPLLYRVVVCVALFLLVMVAGYFFHTKDLYALLENAEKKETSLRQTYKEKAFEVANLEAYKQQMVELEASFNALLGQLPADTEVPGLLEDITDLGHGSSLEINTISLQPERAQEFYVELPIKIIAGGGYHDVATFVSGVAGLPRIVTLHDFSLKTTDKGGQQVFELEAKTYRYKGEDDGAK